jgi:hypothetical protein
VRDVVSAFSYKSNPAAAHQRLFDRLALERLDAVQLKNGVRIALAASVRRGQAVRCFMHTSTWD